MSESEIHWEKLEDVTWKYYIQFQMALTKEFLNFCRIKLKIGFWLYIKSWHTSWKFQLEIRSNQNKNVIAKKHLTNLYEMNSTGLTTGQHTHFQLGYVLALSSISFFLSLHYLLHLAKKDKYTSLLLLFIRLNEWVLGTWEIPNWQRNKSVINNSLKAFEKKKK